MADHDELGFVPAEQHEPTSPHNDTPETTDMDSDLGFQPMSAAVTEKHDELGFMPSEEHAPVEDKSEYQTTGQKILTGLEGAAQGATFGLSNKIETGLGLTTPEDIAARQEANPGIHTAGEITGTVGSMFIPIVGEGWLLGKAAAKLVPIAANAGKWSKLGRLALRAGIESGGMQAGDELGNALIGKGNSADAVAMHIVGSGLIGMCVGGGMAGGNQALASAADSKIGQYLNDFAAGLGAAKEGRGKEVIALLKEAGAPVPKGLAAGVKMYETMEQKAAQKVATSVSHYGAATAAGAAGTALGGTTVGVGAATAAYHAAKTYLDPYAEKLASKVAAPLTKKVLAPVMIKAIDAGQNIGATAALQYAAKAAAGQSAINKAIAQTMKKTVQKGYDYSVSPEQLDEADEYISNGGIQQQINELNHNEEPQAFAKGGKVQSVTPKPLNSDMQNIYPDQHIMLTTAKSRMSNYLSGLKPQKPIGTPAFDTPYHDKDAEKNYRGALTVAIKPLSVLHKIQKGTIKAADVKHLSAMYPEVHDLLAKKLTEELTKSQLEGERPNSKTLQGLSLFLGAPLKSYMSQPGIAAAQSSFAPQSPAQGAQANNVGKKGKQNQNLLEKIPKQYQTSSQARDARANKDT